MFKRWASGRSFLSLDLKSIVCVEQRDYIGNLSVFQFFVKIVKNIMIKKFYLKKN